MRAKTRAELEKLTKQSKFEKRGASLRESVKRKAVVVEEIKSLLKQYRTMAIVSVDGIPTKESRRVYDKLHSLGCVVKLYKNSLVLRALREVDAENLGSLAKYLTGPNVYLFTNLNPFELAKVIEESVEYRYAKPGDTVAFDVELGPGPTDIKPGPSMSLFGKLKIPIQVREGQIWIAKDVKVLKAGDTVSAELASLLRKLGVTVIPVKAKLKAVYEGGLVYTPEVLKIDYESIRKSFIEAVSYSKVLVVELALPLPEVVPELLVRAFRASVEVALRAGYLTADTAPAVISRAVGVALALASALAGKVDLGLGIAVATPATPSVSEERVSKKQEREEGGKEKEEVTEEEIAEGISSLFG
jgi:large subunit ribosomal protein L10